MSDAAASWWKRLVTDGRRRVNGHEYIDLGRGVVEARLASGDRVRIRPTARRIYDDLAPDPRRFAAQRLAAVVKPGSRVLVLGAGTGAAADLLAEAAGPTGTLVSLDSDGESVRFARRRYASDVAAMEIGTYRSLRGELDGAFDAALLCEPGHAEGDEVVSPELLAEVERVLGRPAYVTVVCELGLSRARSVAAAIEKLPGGLATGLAIEQEGDGWGVVSASRERASGG
ncbi:MAG: methyltransferase domain-containing protein [Planctomycetota bacterium]